MHTFICMRNNHFHFKQSLPHKSKESLHSSRMKVIGCQNIVLIHSTTCHILMCHMTRVVQNSIRLSNKKQPGAGFWPTIPFIIWHQTFVRKIGIWMHKG